MIKAALNNKAKLNQLLKKNGFIFDTLKSFHLLFLKTLPKENGTASNFVPLSQKNLKELKNELKFLLLRLWVDLMRA